MDAGESRLTGEESSEGSAPRYEAVVPVVVDVEGLVCRCDFGDHEEGNEGAEEDSRTVGFR